MKKVLWAYLFSCLWLASIEQIMLGGKAEIKPSEDESLIAEEFDIGEEGIVDSLQQDDDYCYHYPCEDSEVFEDGSGDAAKGGVMDVERRHWFE